MNVFFLAASLLLSAIDLPGVSASHLRAYPSLDTHNARLGDPLTLTIDFIGNADFSSLHPPALSRHVDSGTWKVDDISAKTSTYLNARRLEYRIRPLKEGLLWFPALEFSLHDRYQNKMTVSTVPMPVRVRKGVQAVLAGLDSDVDGMPLPDALSFAVPEGLSEDEIFLWRKACATSDPALFAQFDTPRARLNEAACRIVAGEWAAALSIYSRFEWITGQTPEIERGITAALARKYDDRTMTLPVWRDTFRPILRYAWFGRLTVILLFAVALFLVFYAAGRLIKLAALFALLLHAFPAQADVFSVFEREFNSAFGRRRSFFSTSSSSKADDIRVTVKPQSTNLSVGEVVTLGIDVEVPIDVSLSSLSLSIEPGSIFKPVGDVENLPDIVSPKNPSNVVKRITIPVVCLKKGENDISVKVSGYATEERKIKSRFGGVGVSRSTVNFRSSSPSVSVTCAPLRSRGRPEGFKGIVGTLKSFKRKPSTLQVGTNDVVLLMCTLEVNGYIPDGIFEGQLDRNPGRIVWREFHIADGSKEIPEGRVPYYDIMTSSYTNAVAPRLEYVYHPEDGGIKEEESVKVLDDARGDATGGVKLYFKPSEESPVVGVVQADAPVRETERYSDWVRVDNGSCAGWTRRITDLLIMETGKTVTGKE